MTNAIRPDVTASLLPAGEARTRANGRPGKLMGNVLKRYRGDVWWLATERLEGRAHESGRPERGPPVFMLMVAEEPLAQESEHP